MTEIEATVARQLAAYDGLGILRAGTDADRRAALWLAAQANGEVVPVPFSRFVPGEAWIEVVGRRLDGLPLFDAPPGEVSGPLGPAGRATGHRPQKLVHRPGGLGRVIPGGQRPANRALSQYQSAYW